MKMGQPVTGINSPTIKPEPDESDKNELEEMRAQVWAAGATSEDAAFIARMLWRNGIRFVKVQMDHGLQLREPALGDVKEACAAQGSWNDLKQGC